MSAVLDAILYRFTSTGDTLVGLTDSEKIEFNLGTAPDSTGRMFSSKMLMNRDVNIHPNPRRALDQVQDSLLGLLNVVVNGYFVSHKTTLGPKNFFNWQVDPATNGDFPFGRFGLQLNGFANGLLNLTPTNLTGYILYNVEVDDVEDPRDEARFTAELYRNGDIATV